MQNNKVDDLIKQGLVKEKDLKETSILIETIKMEAGLQLSRAIKKELKMLNARLNTMIIPNLQIFDNTLENTIQNNNLKNDILQEIQRQQAGFSSIMQDTFQGILAIILTKEFKQKTISKGQSLLIDNMLNQRNVAIPNRIYQNTIKILDKLDDVIYNARYSKSIEEMINSNSFKGLDIADKEFLKSWKNDYLNLTDDYIQRQKDLSKLNQKLTNWRIKEFDKLNKHSQDSIIGDASNGTGSGYNESANMVEYTRNETYKALNPKFKVWVAILDKKTRGLHVGLDGDYIPFNQPFIDKDGNKMMYPRDMSLGADAGTIANCRCTYYVIK